ncbi:MAG: TonB family protein [Acidobacteriota bacterium]|nr:TonB family protein [Acidobacteriota bacterium]
MTQRGRLFRLAAVWGILAIQQAVGAAAQRVSSATVNESAMRRSALKKVAPIYPPQGLARKTQGVAVSAVHVDRTGSVVSVRVLQSPGPEFEAAVLDAVKQWKFSVVSAGLRGAEGPIEVDTKLTFYFSVDRSGKGQVSDPPAAAETAAAGGRAVAAVEEVLSGAMAKWLAPGKTGLLDPRSREDFAVVRDPRAINVPGDELIPRLTELARFESVLLDCRRSAPPICRSYGRTLADSGNFKRVGLLMETFRK